MLATVHSTRDHHTSTCTHYELRLISPHVAFPCCWTMICKWDTYWTSHLAMHIVHRAESSNASSQEAASSGAFGWVVIDLITSTSCSESSNWDGLWVRGWISSSVGSGCDLEVVQWVVPAWPWLQMVSSNFACDLCYSSASSWAGPEVIRIIRCWVGTWVIFSSR